MGKYSHPYKPYTELDQLVHLLEIWVENTAAFMETRSREPDFKGLQTQ